jgi:NitT/TauT family transport system substrate-binding protein
LLRGKKKAEAMKSIHTLCCAALTWGALLTPAPPAAAEDVLKVVVPHRGAWETAAPELGQQAGIFKKHGVVVELRYTDNGSEAEASVTSGNADIGLGIEALSVLRAFSRGAPVRIIGANLTGDTNYWYVPAASPIRTIKDFADRTVGYAKNGSSSHYDLIDLLKRAKVRARLVATGGAAAGYEQVQQNRLDVGWGRPPFGAEDVEQGKIRIVARSNDLPRTRSKTETVLMTNAATMQSRGDVVARFMRAYRESIDWMYADPQAIERYAAFAGISRPAAQRVREDFFNKGMLLPDQIVGLRAILGEARAQRYIQFRMSRKEIAELIRTPTPVRGSLFGAFAAP